MQKRVIFLFLGLFLGVFLFMGCSFKKEPVLETQDTWEDEVLMVKECGMDRLKCCDDNPACYYGQICCEAPDGSAKNYCADSCDFGTQNNFCRKDEDKCDENLACSQSYCLSCGDKDELCCDNDSCNDDLVCYNNKCVVCGLSGNPCCGESCSNETRMECKNGICRECGFGGKSICTNEPFCNSGNLENNKSCLECGKLNLPCCSLDNNKICEKDLVCDRGFCNKK